MKRKTIQTRPHDKRHEYLSAEFESFLFLLIGAILSFYTQTFFGRAPMTVAEDGWPPNVSIL